jgi:hypothetical protein
VPLWIPDQASPYRVADGHECVLPDDSLRSGGWWQLSKLETTEISKSAAFFCTSQVEANLNIAPGWLQAASARATSGLKLLPEAEDSGVRWTETQVAASEPETKAEQQPIEKPLESQAADDQNGMEATKGRAILADNVTTSQSELLPKAEALSRAQGQNEGAQVKLEEPILGSRVTSGSPEGTTRLTSQADQIKGDFSDQADASTQQTEGQTSDQTRKRLLDDASDALGAPPRKKMDYRRWICGEESLHIAHCEPYVLRRPIRRGRLNMSNSYPLQQVKDLLRTAFALGRASG